jgi:uncharacterized protein YgiM (DUF1202 family)
MHPPSLRLTGISTISVALLLALTGCSKDSTDVLGQAYVAPASLNLRGELDQKNSAVAVLHHGERVSIIDIRRRFVKIRSQHGQEGWVDALQLLSPEQMDKIRREAQRALALPSQGLAGVYEALNVHIDPSRQSPAFTRIPEGGSVAVLAHRVEPKTSDPAKLPTLIADPSQASLHRQRRERQSNNSAHLPPPPPSPKAPANWQELSAERIDHPDTTARLKVRTEQKIAEQKARELKKPVILEDWTLVRTKDNQIGWVLSRNLVMSIPDEVAQYAEGKRITSYFDLGAVQDEKKGPKHNWLWTTASEVEPFDYDASRVFIWNHRRHRYETSFRRHDLEGYFPVEVDPPDSGTFGRTFKLITKDDDGKFRRRTYFFDGTRVHLTGAEAYKPGTSTDRNRSQPLDTNKLQANLVHDSWLRYEWNTFKHRIFRTN